MPEGVDEAANAFANEIAPQSRPRDTAGKFVTTQGKPEPVFGPRPIEGDPETGDTSDGGDDPSLRRHESRVAAKPPTREPDDAEVEDTELEPEEIGESEPSGSEPAEDDDKYEVTIDGAPHEVTLKEALAGYIRQETFHKRQAQLLNIQHDLQTEYGRLQGNWQLWDKARKDYEEDLGNMIPKEPNWDQEFARDPAEAYRQQRTYQLLYGKLAASQQSRAAREAAQKDEQARWLQRYRDDGYNKFVEAHRKDMPDEQTLDKNLRSMRRTAATAGFSDEEVATVYDPRMLEILWKASKYDRMTANRPLAVIPGKGKTLTPGAATPLGNARRSGFDDAQRKLASSGKLQDAVEVFRRML